MERCLKPEDFILENKKPSLVCVSFYDQGQESSDVLTIFFLEMCNHLLKTLSVPGTIKGSITRRYLRPPRHLFSHFESKVWRQWPGSTLYCWTLMLQLQLWDAQQAPALHYAPGRLSGNAVATKQGEWERQREVPHPPQSHPQLRLENSSAALLSPDLVP